MQACRDEATRKAGVDEVAEGGFRAGGERAECGGVLPCARGMRSAVFAWKKRLREAETAKFVEVKLAGAAQPIRE